MSKFIDCEKYADLFKAHLDDIKAGRTFKVDNNTYFCSYGLDGFYHINSFRLNDDKIDAEIPLSMDIIRFYFASGTAKEIKL